LSTQLLFVFLHAECYQTATTINLCLDETVNLYLHKTINLHHYQMPGQLILKLCQLVSAHQSLSSLRVALSTDVNEQ